MRFELLSTALLLTAPAIAAPTPGNDDCSTTVKPGQSIQKAIDNAKKGDKITVEAGTYAEQLTITKSIQLIGKNAILTPPKTLSKNFCTGLSKTFPPESKDTDAGICIYGKGFQLGPYPGQEHRKVQTEGEYVADVTVSGFDIRGFNGENIAVVGGKDTKIINNKLTSGGQYGFLTVGSKNTLAENNVVTSTTLDFIALCMDDKTEAKFKGNDISNYVIALCTQTNGGLVKNNKVKNCCIGPYVDPGIKNAQIIENTISGRNAYCPSRLGAGIVISGASNILVEKNTFENINNNSTGSPTGVGLFLEDSAIGPKATGNVIRKNIFKNNDFDIFNNSTSTTNKFEGNSCKSSFPAGYC